MLRRFSAVFAILFIVGCASNEALPPAPLAPWKSSAEDSRPLKESTKYVMYSPQWELRTRGAYQNAINYVHAYDKKHPNEDWVVVMDIDQTVLNNVMYQMALDRKGASYSPGTWHSWVKERKATMIPGAEAFIRKVDKLGGEIVFITNRRDYEVKPTEDNLAYWGIKKGRFYSEIISRKWPDGEESKEARYSDVDGNVIAYVGDVVGDKPANLGDSKFFCIPQGGLYGTNCR